MKTIKLIQEARRKELRYLMFRKRDDKSLDVPFFTAKQAKAILKHYEKQEEFTTWEDFEWKWDIGLGGESHEEATARANRKEKWFLFDADKSKSVRRPADYWDKESKRRGITTHTLQELEKTRLQIDRTEFYKRFF